MSDLLEIYNRYGKATTKELQILPTSIFWDDLLDLLVDYTVELLIYTANNKYRVFLLTALEII